MSPAKKKPEILTEQQIIDADDLKSEVIDVPEWGGAVKFRQVTRDQYNQAVDDSVVGDEFDGELFDLHLLIATQVEPKLTKDRVQELRGKSASVMRRLTIRAHQFNDVNPGSLEAAVATFQDEARS